jgi:hypothetical protein
MTRHRMAKPHALRWSAAEWEEFLDQLEALDLAGVELTPEEAASKARIHRFLQSLVDTARAPRH